MMNEEERIVPVNPLLVARGAGLVHTQQTTKQPVVFRCQNPECRESAFERYFDFISDYPECPKCTLGPPTVQKRSLIHLLVRDKMGNIVGDMGLRYRVACDQKRFELATVLNGEAASGDPFEINCPGCMKSPEFQAEIRHGTSLVLGEKDKG